MKKCEHKQWKDSSKGDDYWQECMFCGKKEKCYCDECGKEIKSYDTCRNICSVCRDSVAV